MSPAHAAHPHHHCSTPAAPLQHPCSIVNRKLYAYIAIAILFSWFSRFSGLSHHIQLLNRATPPEYPATLRHRSLWPPYSVLSLTWRYFQSCPPAARTILNRGLPRLSRLSTWNYGLSFHDLYHGLSKLAKSNLSTTRATAKLL